MVDSTQQNGISSIIMRWLQLITLAQAQDNFENTAIQLFSLAQFECQSPQGSLVSSKNL